MSDEGEKTCPLCAEEMDLTDQQLRPCKCGYDICVWCWHHIMDMAEKDDTEGRCPACRTPYNKEKIVGTASKCERLVAEMSVEKKQKSLKGKTKTSEGRKQLSSVRVIQRNLVYIVGLPLNLADEDLLQRKEYFGQYGKVLKVSISRTAAGTIQHFANNTCSVYITYAKEDEAIRSIQAVHGFVFEGRPLRACFGTTKYCHAWLRNMPCTNPDCLYLHEFGSQDDSFTKDEIISEYTRGRVQQVTGVNTNEMQRRSGNMLPPAADDFSNNTTSAWAKPIVNKSPTNDPANSMKGSPPNSSSGRSVALPAAASWGTRASNNQPLAINVLTSNGPSKQKAGTCTSPVVSPSSSSHSEETQEIPTSNEHKTSLEKSESTRQITATGSDPDPTPDESNEATIHQLSSDTSSLTITTLQPSDNENILEPSISNIPTTAVSPTLNISITRQDSSSQELAISEAEADLLSFNDQRLRDPELVTHNNNNTSYVHNNIPQPSHLNNYHYTPVASQNHNDVDSLFEGSNGHSYFHSTENSNKQSRIFQDTKRDRNNNDVNTRGLNLGENSIISNILSMDFDPWGEESLTSPQNLAKLLGDGDKLHRPQSVTGSRKTQNSNQSRFSFAREDEFVDRGSNFVQNSSDFGVRSFDRDFVGNTDVYSGHLINGNDNMNGFSCFNFEESDRVAANHSPFSSNKISASRSQISAPPGFMGPSRAPPPGFASNERIEQTYDNLSGNHMFDASSLLRKAHQTQTPTPVYNNGTNDLEFMDPAILAVGGRVPNGFDIRPNYSSQLSSFENDNNRLRLLVQRSFTQQNQRYNDLADNNCPQRTDAYGISSRMMEQTLPNSRSPYQQQQSNGFQQQARSSLLSNGNHWDGWNEVQSGNDIAMAEILRNERLGFGKYYSSGYEDTKFRMTSSGDLYNNRTYGI